MQQFFQSASRAMFTPMPTLSRLAIPLLAMILTPKYFTIHAALSGQL
jgi:hypothetical protein